MHSAEVAQSNPAPTDKRQKPTDIFTVPEEPADRALSEKPIVQLKPNESSVNFEEKNKFNPANDSALPDQSKPSASLQIEETTQSTRLAQFGPKLDAASQEPYAKAADTTPIESNPTVSLLREVKNKPGAGILIDVGHSCTHVIPIFDNQVIGSSIRRAEVGGKLISKFLMESVSLTQFDLSKHFFLVSDLKEKCCQILSSPGEFLDIRQRPSLNRLSRVYYALNDYEICKRGGVVPNPSPEQLKIAKNLQNLVTLQLERIIFPEILFQPSL